MKPLSMIIASFVLLIGCQNKEAGLDSAAVTDSTAITGVVGESPKQVTTARLQAQVKDVNETLHVITRITGEMGGLITRQSVTSREEEQKQLRLSNDSLQQITVFHTEGLTSVRVPADSLDAFLETIRQQFSFVRYSELQREDKSLVYLADRWKAKARTATVENTSTHKTLSRAGIQTTDERIDYLLANRQIDYDVAYSTVELTLDAYPAVRKERIANTMLDTYALPYGWRFRQAIRRGWQAFEEVTLLLLHAWPFLLLVFAAWMVVKIYRMQKHMPSKTVV